MHKVWNLKIKIGVVGVLFLLSLIAGSVPLGGSGQSPVVRLVRVEEKLSIPTSYYYSSGSVSSYSNRHGAKLIFKWITDNEVSTTGAPGDLTTTTGGSTTSTTTSTSGGGLLETGEYTLTTGSTGSTSTTGLSTGGLSGGDPPRSFIHVDEDSQFGIIPQDSTQVPLPHVQIDGLPQGMVYEIDSGYEVPVQFTSTGVLSGGDVTVTVEYYLPGVADDPGTPGNEYVEARSVFEKVTYTLNKVVCHDASVDSRKTHGQPNLDGQLPGDPNADAKNVNFGDWVWKGGLFAGRVPWTANDYSGTARIQLYPQGATGYVPRLVALTLFHQGPNSRFTGDLDLGVFLPSDEDENLETTEGTLTWANKWGIVPQADPADPPDDSVYPVSKRLLTGSFQDYVNWQLTTVSKQETKTSSMALQALCLAAHDEEAWSTTHSAWRYFGSREYQALFPTEFPKNDCAPRLWVVTKGESTVWIKNWGSSAHSW
jgi:hypothetical protein